MRREIQRFIFFAETESYLLRAACWNAVETRPRHTGDAHFAYQVLRQLDVVREAKCTDVGHDVIGAVGAKYFEPGVLKHRQKQIAARAIFRLQSIIVFGGQRQRVSARALQWRGRADSQEVVDLANGAGDLRRCDAVTDAPTSYRIG